MPKKEYTSLSMIWRNVAITIEHNDNYSISYNQVYGTALTHTNINRDDGLELPITDTGYRSLFLDSSVLDNYEDILDYIRQWLDHEAKSKAWLAKEADQIQLKLF